MKKEFIVVAFGWGNNDYKTMMYDAADYDWTLTVVGCLIRRKSDDRIVFAVPMSRLFNVRLV